MSYILNALRKSEQDRQAQETSNPEITILETLPKNNSKISWLVFSLIFINILVLIFFIFLNPGQQPTTTESKTPSLTAAKKTKTVSKTELPKQKPVAAKPDLASKKASPTPNQQASISKMLKQPHSVTKRVPKRAVKNVATITRKINSAEPYTSRPPAAENKPITVDQPPARVSNEPDTSKEIPFLQNMPPAFRRNVPDLNINVFVYAKNPDERFVIIDMKKYRTGQETTNGLEIKEINSNSLTLRYQNRTFKIKRP